MTTAMYDTPGYFTQYVIDPSTIPTQSQIDTLNKALDRFYKKRGVSDLYGLVTTDNPGKTLDEAILFIRSDSTLTAADQRPLTEVLETIRDNMDTYNFIKRKSNHTDHKIKVAVKVAAPIQNFIASYEAIVQRTSQVTHKIDPNTLPESPSALNITLATQNAMVVYADPAITVTEQNLPVEGQKFFYGSDQDLTVIRIFFKRITDQEVVKNKALCLVKAVKFHLEYLKCSSEQTDITDLDLVCSPFMFQYNTAIGNCDGHYPITLGDELFSKSLQMIEQPQGEIKGGAVVHGYEEVGKGIKLLESTSQVLIAGDPASLPDVKVNSSLVDATLNNTLASLGKVHPAIAAADNQTPTSGSSMIPVEVASHPVPPSEPAAGSHVPSPAAKPHADCHALQPSHNECPNAEEMTLAGHDNNAGGGN